MARTGAKLAAHGVDELFDANLDNVHVEAVKLVGDLLPGAGRTRVPGEILDKVELEPAQVERYLVDPDFASADVDFDPAELAPLTIGQRLIRQEGRDRAGLPDVCRKAGEELDLIDGQDDEVVRSSLQDLRLRARAGGTRDAEDGDEDVALADLPAESGGEEVGAPSAAQGDDDRRGPEVTLVKPGSTPTEAVDLNVEAIRLKHFDEWPHHLLARDDELDDGARGDQRRVTSRSECQDHGRSLPAGSVATRAADGLVGVACSTQRSQLAVISLSRMTTPAAAWDTATDFGARVERLLHEEATIWLTHVNSHGVPLTNAVWSTWDGETLLVYSATNALRNRGIPKNPNVCFHFNTDFHGHETTILHGIATLSDDPPADGNEAYMAKYGAQMHDSLKMTSEQYAAGFSVPIRIRPTRSHGF